MYTLFINNASQQGQIALCTGTECIAFIPIAARITEAELTADIESVLQTANIAYADVTHLACVHGPGGFTSLRMGVTAVNVIHTLLQIPIAAIHLADLHHARVQSQNTTGVWLHSTKRDLVFIQGFGEYKKLWSDPTLLTITECKEKLPAKTNWCGELLDQHVVDLGSCLGAPLELESLQNILSNYLQSLTYVNTPIVPWYGRQG